MSIPPMSREAILEVMRQFRNGNRSSQGPDPGKDWLGDGRYGYVIVEDDQPYPVKEIIRLAVKGAIGAWPLEFWGGDQAERYVKRHDFTVVEQAAWLGASGRT